jgi:hypothetical protein
MMRRISILFFLILSSSASTYSMEAEDNQYHELTPLPPLLTTSEYATLWRVQPREHFLYQGTWYETISITETPLAPGTVRDPGWYECTETELPTPTQEPYQPAQPISRTSCMRTLIGKRVYDKEWERLFMQRTKIGIALGCLLQTPCHGISLPPVPYCRHLKKSELPKKPLCCSPWCCFKRKSKLGDQDL